MSVAVQSTTYASAPSVAFAGMIVGDDYETMSMKNVEASAAMPFGRGVIFKGSNTTDQDALVPSAETDKVCGIVAHSHAYQRSYTNAAGATVGELSSAGLLPGAMLNVLRRGIIWVIAEDAVVPGDRLWIRCTAGGAGEVVGGCVPADEGTETIDCTNQGVFLTTASAGALAQLQVDFTSRPT